MFRLPEILRHTVSQCLRMSTWGRYTACGVGAVDFTVFHHEAIKDLSQMRFPLISRIKHAFLQQRPAPLITVDWHLL
ncbi:hypothetical protein GQ607_009396 [Colletotrichum asianum]|uniref:Uncharacterized protein n=1 Tax=Colletotrichum asianum TaxID=702518 RepID=A0A8H3W8H9_9PEZI|nr:hypothetical protein GQ607_009396 [Colletotrichum asianum]